jgi:hypothetical protein
VEIQLGSLLVAVLLACVYIFRGAARLESEAGRELRRWAVVSAAAGVSIAYVFVDVLPELAAQNRALRESSATELAFAEQRIYILALLSFVVMYGIEHIVLKRRPARRETIAGETRDAVYWLHLLGFSAYSSLIGYLLVERAERGSGALAVYAAAMTVHFLVVNHSLAEEHGNIYRRHGHWVLAASVLGGWLLGIVAPLSEVMFARLFAVLAGGVVITSLRAELPDDRRGRFWPFCVAAIGFAVLLLLA